MNPQITVATPTIVPRAMLLNRAMRSVARQSLAAAAYSVAVDIDKQGAPATRQRALDAVRTEWVAFLDDDDVLKPEHLEALYRHALDTGADYVYSWFDMVGGVDPFPPGHYLNEFDPANPIETTITTLVRTELAQSVGFHRLDRGHDTNTGEDYGFTLGCVERGARIRHLVRRTWFYNVHPGNTSGLPTKGDAKLWQPATI